MDTITLGASRFEGRPITLKGEERERVRVKKEEKAMTGTELLRAMSTGMLPALIQETLIGKLRTLTTNEIHHAVGQASKVLNGVSVAKGFFDENFEQV